MAIVLAVFVVMRHIVSQYAQKNRQYEQGSEAEPQDPGRHDEATAPIRKGSGRE